MLKDFIDYILYWSNRILYKLHLVKKLREQKDALESILELMPTLITIGIVMSIAKSLFPTRKLCWYEKVGIQLKHSLMKFRMKYIGY